MSGLEYVLVEYRRQKGQDKFLPDEGLAVYVIDESIQDVNNENRLAVELIQADGRRDLARLARFGNTGDPDDLYPFGDNNTIGKSTIPPLRLPDGRWAGITIRVNGPAGPDTISVDVEVHSDGLEA